MTSANATATARAAAPATTAATTPVAIAKVNHAGDEQMTQVLQALNDSGKVYEARRVPAKGSRNGKIHVKHGHLFENYVFGCLAQCYKYDIELSPSGQVVAVTSTVRGAGFYGGLIGKAMQAGETNRVRTVLMGKTFSS